MRIASSRRYVPVSMSTKDDSIDKKGADEEETDKEETDKEEDKEMTVYSKNGRRRQGGELPFDVCVVSPPRRHLGTFQLDPLTHCGDIIDHGGQQFEVKVVKFKYKYTQGRYRIIGKCIEVKSLARKAIEIFLERNFNRS